MERPSNSVRDKGRDGRGEGSKVQGSGGGGGIMQTNRNPSATKRVPINSEMSPVKIQARARAAG